MGDYHDFYLKTDVFLLTVVSEEFRNVCLKYFGVDPGRYFSSPGCHA